MTCPFCAAIENTVYESRRLTGTIRRARRCTTCGKRWTTYEISAGVLDLFDTEMRSIIASTEERLEALRMKLVGSAQPSGTTREQRGDAP